MRRKTSLGCRLESTRHIRCKYCSNACPIRTNGMGRQPYKPVLTSNDGDEITNLVFNLLFRRNGLGDPFPQKYSEVLAQPVHGHVNRANAHAEFGSQIRARNVALAAGKEGLQVLK